MAGKLRALALAALMTVSMLFGAAAPAAAQSAGNDLPMSHTMSVGEDTEGIHVTAENASDTLDVTVYGLDSDGNETQVATGTLDATGETTDTYEFRDINATKYPSYRVNVTGATDSTTVEYVEINKLQLVGGGGLLGGLGGSSPIVWLGLAAVVTAGVGLLLMREG